MHTDKAVKITKHSSPGLHVVTLSRLSCEETFITSVAQKGESAADTFSKAAGIIKASGAGIVSQEIFGFAEEGGGQLHALQEVFGQITWPVTWVGNSSRDNLAGTQVWAVSGVPVKPIELDGRVVGNVFADEFGRYCRLGDIRPRTNTARPAEQARETFENLERSLTKAQMDLSHVFRTWFYNHEITSWYDQFNEVRDNFFNQKGVFGRLLPSSTAVGGSNPWDTALVAGLVALQSKDDKALLSAVASPLQCPAPDYGSSFSRAVELAMPDHRRLFVSGTASITADGKTICVGDMSGQVERTMQVVAAILESRDMDFSNVVRGIAYVRNAEDAPQFAQYCTAHNLEDMPVITACNTICRDDLLFEIEVDAVK